MCRKGLSARCVVGIVSFFGMMNLYMLRLNMSIAITAMVDYEGLAQLRHGHNTSISNNTWILQLNNITTEKCGRNISVKKPIAKRYDDVSNEELFLWNENKQALALGAYFYGYICSQIAGAYLATKIGHARLWGWCGFLSAVSTLLTPAALTLSFEAFVIARISVGLFAGVSFPIMHGLWSAWAPPAERGRLLALEYAGGPVGIFTVLPLCGFLSSEWGWSAVFYATGIFGIAWAIVCLLLLHDSPMSHPRISSEEREYIQSSLELDNKRIHSSGLLSAIPYIVKLVMTFVTGFLADIAISKGFGIYRVRKLWSSIGCFVPPIALAASGYVNCNIKLLMLLFAIPVGFGTFNTSGFKTSMIEIAPPFSGIVFGIANTLAMSTGFLAPQIAGALLQTYNAHPIIGWRILFWIAAAIYCTGGATFVFLGTSRIQKWASPRPKDDAPSEGTNLKMI